MDERKLEQVSDFVLDSSNKSQVFKVASGRKGDIECVKDAAKGPP